MWVGTTGYYGKPEATLQLYKNGWIHTGDMGRMDADGYFYFADRKKQAIRRRGENISSFEVEAVISAHEAVLECCVVGVPSEVGEEEVKAVVVLKPGRSATHEEIVRCNLADRDAAFVTAKAVLTGAVADPTNGALFFHASRIRPGWFETRARVGKIGNHVFYR